MQRSILILSLAVLTLLAGAATAQVIIRIRPGAAPPSSSAPPAPLPAPTPVTTSGLKLEAIAETKLLMEALANPNYQALAKALKDRPADAEAWTFARGQALLIAETSNLLMLRPPKNLGQDVWMTRSTELRDAATKLAKQAGSRDLPGSRAALLGVVKSCNRCHESFRVTTRIGPEPDKIEGKKIDAE